MATVEDFDQVIEPYHLALGKIMNGDTDGYKQLYSHREDVTLANPFGPPARGWEQVVATMERAASQFRDGEIVGFEPLAKYVTPELAYTVWVERSKGKVGEREDIVPFPLRVTTIFRPEEGTWKIVHRHADPITTPRPAESVIQE